MAEKKAIDHIASSFSSSTSADWAKVAEKEVSSQNPWEVLAWQSDGILFKPYYDGTDLRNLQSLQLPVANSPYYGARAWHNMPCVVVTNEETANTMALQHLANGADGILFDLQEKKINFEKLLKGIGWPYCSLSFKNVPSDFTRSITEHAQTAKLNTSQLQGTLFLKNFQDNLFVATELTHLQSKYK